MTVANTPNRVTVLSAVADKIAANLAATAGNAVDLSTVKATTFPVGTVADASKETVYVGIPTGLETQPTAVGNRHLTDVWALAVVIRCQPDGGTEASWLAALARCEKVVGIVLASMHGDDAVVVPSGVGRVSNIEGPAPADGSPLVAEAVVTFTITSNLHPAVPSS